jgi:hypothetical protein
LTPLLLPDFAVEEPRLIRRRQDADNQLQHDQTLAGRYADLIIAIL